MGLFVFYVSIQHVWCIIFTNHLWYISQLVTVPHLVGYVLLAVSYESTHCALSIRKQQSWNKWTVTSQAHHRRVSHQVEIGGGRRGENSLFWEIPWVTLAFLSSEGLQKNLKVNVGTHITGAGKGYPWMSEECFKACLEESHDQNNVTARNIYKKQKAIKWCLAVQSLYKQTNKYKQKITTTNQHNVLRLSSPIKISISCQPIKK